MKRGGGWREERGGDGMYLPIAEAANTLLFSAKSITADSQIYIREPDPGTRDQDSSPGTSCDHQTRDVASSSVV